MYQVKRQEGLIKDALRFVAMAVAYGVILGTVMGVSALFLLHVLYGFSLVPCEFARENCQVTPAAQTLPIPHVKLSFPGDPIGVSSFPPGAFVLMLKASRER